MIQSFISHKLVMRGIIPAVLLFVLTFLPVVAGACSYPSPPTFKSALKDATAVFVFRLDAAEYKRTNLGSSAYAAWVEGKVKPVQSLYGDSSAYKTIEYSTAWCGDVNLVVGHHYLVATKASDGVIELAPADGSIIDIEGFYDPNRKKESLRSFLILPVIQDIYGFKALPNNFPPRDIAARTVLQAPPPPRGE